MNIRIITKRLDEYFKSEEELLEPEASENLRYFLNKTIVTRRKITWNKTQLPKCKKRQKSRKA